MGGTLVASCALGVCVTAAAFATTTTSRHVVFYVGPCVKVDAKTDQLEQALGLRSVIRYERALQGFAADLASEQRAALETEAGVYSVQREPVDVVVFLLRPAAQRAEALEKSFGFRRRPDFGLRAGLSARLTARQIAALDSDPGVLSLVPGRWNYIVTLKLPLGDVTAIDAKIDDLERRLGFRAHYRYHHALAGFAATLDSQQLSGVGRDLAVSAVEADRCHPRLPEGPQPEPPRLRAGGVTLTPRSPTAGRRFAIRLALLRPGRPLRPARLDKPRIRCSARLQGQLLRSVAQVHGTAVRCSWHLPRRAHGKRLSASIEASDLTTPSDPGVHKTFSTRVR
jgi:hypothetical protein